MYRSTVSFLADGLPSLVDTSRPLNVVFATYNSVHGYSNGPVETGKPKLKIVVQNGYQPFDFEDALLLTTAIEVGDIHLLGNIIDKWQRQCDASQEDVENGVADQTDMAKDVPILAIVYAGLIAFERSFEFARGLRRNNPDAKVVVLTCDCNVHDKAQALEVTRTAGEIDDFIISSQCGGESEMRTILDALIELWPS